MNKNIAAFKKAVSFSIIWPLIYFTILTTFLFYAVYSQAKNERNKADKNQINATIQLYQSNLSEKIAIIASSTIFIDFITSGNVTRQEILPQLLEQLATLNSDSVAGLELVNLERNSKFRLGNASPIFANLDLCYLGGRLNNQYGNCRYVLRVFFSEKNIIRSLAALNPTIRACKDCQATDFFLQNKFGSFTFSEHSSLPLYLKLNSDTVNPLTYYLLAITMLLIFSIFNSKKISRLINVSFSDPLATLVHNIKNNQPLQQNKGGIQEITYLAEQIDAWKTQLIEAQKLEKKAAIGEIAANVAHDIRSPLAVIEIMLHANAEHLPKESQEILKEAAQSVRDIANNLLNKHKPTEQSTSNISVNLFTLIQNLIRNKEIEWQHNPCNILFSASPEATSASISIDESELRRMLSNLLNNAYEALSIHRNITLNLHCLRNNLILSIKDDGQGIPQEFIQQVLSGTSLKKDGHGFGLSNARKFMDSQCGMLELTSAHGIGTEIILTFSQHI